MMKFKKFLTGIMAIAIICAGVHLVSAQAPLALLDEANARGVEERGTAEVVIGKTVNAVDGGGVWTLTTGGSGNAVVGEIAVDENNPALINISRGTTSKVRELSVKYTTGSVYTSTDTRVQFTAETDAADNAKAQLIQVSSGRVMSEQPAYGDTWIPSGSLYCHDGAVIRLSDGKLEYVDGLENIWKQTEVEIKKNTRYYFQIERISGGNTYNLYADTEKIGVNTAPIAKNIGLIAPTGVSFQQVACYLGKTGGNDNYHLTLGNIRFLQGTSTEAGSIPIFHEFFDGALGTDWKLYTGGSANAGIVAMKDNALYVYHNNGNKSREIYAAHNIKDMAVEDVLTVEYDFVSDTSSENYVKHIVFASNVADESITKKTFDNKEFSVFPDSVHLLLYNSKFFYADENNQTFTEIPGVSYTNNTKYYVKTIIDNRNYTFDMYLSDRPIGETTVPVLTDIPFFNQTKNEETGMKGAPIAGITVRISRMSGTDASQIMLDNLIISESAAAETKMTDFAVFNDEQQIVTKNSAIDSASYFDIINIPQGKTAILAAYDGADGLLDIQCIFESGYRYRMTDENIKAIKIMLWDSLQTMQPLTSVLEVK